MSQYEPLTADTALERFEELISSTTDAELDQWRHHPCTKALIWSLTYGELKYVEAWRDSAWTVDSAEGTAQLNAKALGAVEAYGIMKKYILEEMAPHDQGDRT